MRWMSALLAAVASFAAGGAAAQSHTDWHTAYLECGGARIRALSECYRETKSCISETLTFERGGRRAVVGLHKHYAPNEVGKLKVPVLVYTAWSWTCLPGTRGGHFLAVSLANGGSCGHCEFVQIYDLNGRLAASSLVFDGDGKSRVDPAFDAKVRTLVGDVGRGALREIYRVR
jgi:hypothetical protein